MNTYFRKIILFSLLAFFTFPGMEVFAQTDEEIKVGYEIGNRAPNIIINNTKDKAIKLSSLKGYIVLIDFWASWCRPCRIENPNVVEAYNSFRKRKFESAKGFKIFSVSLDQKKESWVQAIKADKLDWNLHGSDLTGWKSAAAKSYHVSSIPSNFLLDHRGIIIAKNLRGIDLHYQLEKLAEN